MSDPYIRTTFPDGSVIIVRVEKSGIVFDPETGKPIDAELAVDMLLIKARKFAILDTLGRT